MNVELNNIGTQDFETDRLLLRKFSYNDNDSMRKYWASKEEIQKMYSEPVYATKEQARTLLDKYIASYSNDHYYRWAITLKDNSDCIGQIAYFMINEKNHWGEIEYCIGKEFQNQGYITEAIMGILDYGFNSIGLHKVQVCHKANNIASKRVIEKSGFRYEGTLRDFFYMEGDYVDRLYYSILEEEYRRPE
ncbi:GNAT family N-acetyltransferase [Enterococcus sp. DIV0756]|uniref:GNAT family N-acetyltransferase n=1 Tax=Enterococcus sp. DIV0756 TaxID=2774636 RepID=UPI003F2865E7